MTTFIQQFRNGRKAIAQLRAGEWKAPPESIHDGNVFRLVNNNMQYMWVANGGWFLEVEDTDCFGLFWRHWVWWLAARNVKKQYMPQKPTKPEFVL